MANMLVLTELCESLALVVDDKSYDSIPWINSLRNANKHVLNPDGVIPERPNAKLVKLYLSEMIEQMERLNAVHDGILPTRSVQDLSTAMWQMFDALKSTPDSFTSAPRKGSIDRSP